MTIVTTGDDWIIEQITKQLNKLVDVIKVVDMTELDHVEREMVLIKVAPRSEDKAEVLNLTEIFRGRVVDSSQKTYTIEITGDEKKIEAIVELLKPMGIKEFVRTGKIAIAREGIKKTTP
jgi:acetolactate synthase-1/3 small subunit